MKSNIMELKRFTTKNVGKTGCSAMALAMADSKGERAYI